MLSINERVLSKLLILYVFLLDAGKPMALTSLSKNLLIWINVEVESLPTVFTSKLYSIGSKFELTTASCIGKESAAMT